MLTNSNHADYRHDELPYYLEDNQVFLLKFKSLLIYSLLNTNKILKIQAKTRITT